MNPNLNNSDHNRKIRRRLDGDLDEEVLIQIQKIEKHLDLYSQNILNKKIYLLLLHPEKAKFP